MPEPSTASRTPLERERAVVSALTVLLLVAWLGFAVHRSPRFPGSVAGTLIGIAAAVLMVVPSVAYAAVKRVAALKRRVTLHVSLGTILSWHVWGGILGGLLALIHTGHRFESALGITLTGLALVVIFSGYVGRHFLATVSLELRERQTLLETLVAAYNDLAGSSGVVRRSSEPEAYARARRAAELAGSIADLEYGIKTNEVMKRRFRTWLIVHITASVVFYGVLALHIWASLYFGIRWLA